MDTSLIEPPAPDKWPMITG